jgi:hypothetical protein
MTIGNMEIENVSDSTQAIVTRLRGDEDLGDGVVVTREQEVWID